MTYGRRIGLEHVSVIDAIVVVSVLLVAVTGIHMAVYTDDLRLAWARVAIASFVLLAPIGPLVSNPRLGAISRLAADLPMGSRLDVIRARLRDPVLNVSMRGSLGILVGLVFVMAVKPTLEGSVVVLAIAVLVGVLSARADRS